jgi:hypothetical protein
MIARTGVGSAGLLNALENSGDKNVAAIAERASRSGKLGAFFAAMGVAATILKWLPGSDKTNMLKDGDKWSTLEFVNDIAQLVKPGDYATLFPGLYADTFNPQTEFGKLPADFVSSLGPATHDVVTRLKGVNLLDPAAVRQALQTLPSDSLVRAHWNLDQLSDRIVSKARAAGSSLPHDAGAGDTLVMGGNPDSLDALSLFVTRDLAGPQFERISAQADALYGVHLTDQAAVQARLASVAGVHPEEAAEWARRISSRAAQTGEFYLTREELAGLLADVQQQPVEISQASAAQDLSQALGSSPSDLEVVDAASVLDGVTSGADLVRTSSLARNVGLFLSGAGIAIDAFGAAAGLALSIHGLVTAKDEGTRIASGIGIASGAVGAAAMTLGLLSVVPLAPVLGGAALTLGLVGMWFSLGLDLFKPHVDQFTSFIDRYKDYGVGASSPPDPSAPEAGPAAPAAAAPPSGPAGVENLPLPVFGDSGAPS